MAQQSVPVGDLTICYEVIGDLSDPTILLVNGLGGSLVNWDDEFCEMLVRSGFSVIRFDNRDVGLSSILDDAPRFDRHIPMTDSRQQAAYTLSDMAADAVGLLDVLQVDTAHLVGVSMGGMIAQTIAIEHPGRVLSLCSIMSTTGARNVGNPSKEAYKTLLRPPPKDRDAYIEGELENLSIFGSTGEFVDPQWRRRKVARAFDRGLHPQGTGRQIMAIIASGDRTAALGSVSVPTVVIHGMNDRLVDKSGGEATAAAIASAKLVFMVGLGHELPPASWSPIADAIVDNARSAIRIGESK